MKHRILIDATTIIEKKDGLSQYIISLLDHLPEQAFEEFDFSVLINKRIKRKELWNILNKGRFTIIAVDIAPIGPKRDWDMFWFLKKNKASFDIFHSTSNQYPLCLRNGIATVHDLTFKKYLNSKWWTFNLGSRFLNLVIRNALKRSVAVIAVSEYTKQDLLSNYSNTEFNSNKISVIYEGWEHLLTGDGELISESMPQFTDYLFYVGTTRVHKNMKNLLQAFYLASENLAPGVKLVISGNETYLDSADKTVIAKINAWGARVIFTGFVTRDVLEQLFKNASAFIFPSLSEGFGIPILESFYFKKPLLCSNTTSLPEIAGDAALYFNPDDPVDMANSIVKLLADPSLQNELITRGEQRLKLFSWNKTADETLMLYRKVVKLNN